MQSIWRIAAVTALVLSLGLHWVLLQTVAWSGMLLRYSQSVPFERAVAMTFDGKHPCRLCCAIQKGRAAEKKQEAEKGGSFSKLDLCLPDIIPFTFHPARFAVIADAYHGALRWESPPRPRPKPASCGNLA